MKLRRQAADWNNLSNTRRARGQPAAWRHLSPRRVALNAIMQGRMVTVTRVPVTRANECLTNPIGHCGHILRPPYTSTVTSDILAQHRHIVTSYGL